MTNTTPQPDDIDLEAEYLVEKLSGRLWHVTASGQHIERNRYAEMRKRVGSSSTFINEETLEEYKQRRRAEQ